MEKYIKGTYKKSIFENEKGYVIGIFKVIETNDEELNVYIDKTITFTGYFAELNEEEKYIFYGDTVDHPKYGFQFNVTRNERIKPDDKEGIIEFLASDLFSGIGEKMAKSIVETLGENVLNKIIEEPSCLNLVNKLSYKKQQMIYNSLIKYEESHQTIIYLTELGFTMREALNIYNKYKTNTIINIEHNIYTVIDDVDDMKFLKVDEIARKKDINLENQTRIKAAIFYVCKKLLFETGDTYFFFEEIYNATIKFLKLNIEEDIIHEYIEQLVLESKIVIEEEKYYLKNIYDAENNIANRIEQLLSKSIKPIKNFDKYLKQIEEKFEIKYDKEQIESIKSSLENNVTIITGGPGTGKTTIIKGIVEMYAITNDYNYDILIDKLALLAPTGRASKRISESTLYPASTIHRFLKWNKDNNKFSVNEYNPNFSELIIVDEVSMIDIDLMNNLLLGLTKNIKLILVGDYNQLPSVGAGELLKNLIESNLIKVNKLNLLYRQSDESYIPVLADDIKNDCLNEFVKTTNDYTFLNCSSNNIKNNLRELCKTLISKGYDYKKVQLMAPMYAGMYGIDELNKELQNIFNPQSELKREIKYGSVIFRENDKILQLVNMPDLNVFNGDIGVIKYIIPDNMSKSKKNEIVVDYDGIEIRYLPKDFIKIKHGYIISIHKSQGSEFNIVIIPISMSYYKMLFKKLIYTAITRAKDKLIIIGEAKAFMYGISNNQEKDRKTDIINKLEKFCIKKEK